MFVHPVRFASAVAMLMMCLPWTPMALADDAADAALQQKAEEYNQEHDDAHEQVVCKKEAMTGTRIKKPVCRKVVQSGQHQDEVQRTLTKIQRTSPLKGE